MRKLNLLIAVCFLMTALTLTAGKVSVKFADLGLSDGALDVQSPIHLNEDIDVIFEMGSASGSPTFRETNGRVTLLQGSVVKFIGRSEGVTITEVTMTSNKSSATFSAGAAECIPTGIFTIDKGTCANTWSDLSGANIVQITNTMGAPTFVSIAVTYSGGTASGEDPGTDPGKDPDPTPDDPDEYENIYANSFDAPDDFGMLSVINVESGSKTWKYNKTYNCAEIENDLGSKIAKDDYLVTPVLDLKAGHTYRVSFTAWAANGAYPEKISVVIGQEASAEGLSDVIVEETTVDFTSPQEISRAFTVAADGKYYVALHASSAPGMYRLFADDFVVSRGVQSDAPAEITDFMVIPDPDGALKVNLTLTAPDKTMAGSALEKIDSIVIRRGAYVIASLSAVPGQELSYEDTVENSGSYKYTATVVTPNGKGIDATASVWVGVAAPASPQSLAVEELESGRLKFTWDPVTTNVHGHKISSSQVKYTITIGGSSRVLAQDLTGNEAEIDYPVAGSPQDITYFTLKALTSAGSSAKVATTPVVAVGAPYTMPYVENFPGGTLTSGQVAEVIPDENNTVARWGYFEQLVLDEILPVTPDGGIMAFYPYEDGDISTFRTGKIEVDPASVNPYFSFHYYTIPGAKDYFKVAINSDTIKTVTVGGDVRGWQEELISLDKYKGKVIRISLTAYCVDANVNIGVDNLMVSDLNLEDLELSRVRIPYEFKPGTDHKCSIRVSNLGVNASGAYTVTVSSADETVWSGKGSDLGRGDSDEFEFVINPDFQTSGNVTYEVSLDYDADENVANNSYEVKSAVSSITLPGAENLTAEKTSAGYVMTWDGVDAATLPVRQIVEGFESYDEFITDNVGEWTPIDGDGCSVLGIRDGYHSYPGMFEPMAFMVFNNHDGYFPQIGTSSFDPYEGGQCLISASVDCINSSDRSNDDWLISPRLSGKAQTVKFFARSSGMVFPENIKVMASSTDNLTSSFKEVASFEKLASKWTEYEAELPAGTNYFAIRNVSYDQYILFVDNVSFEAAPLSVKVVGYDLYLGKNDRWELLNEQPVTGNTFTVATIDADKLIKIATRYSNGYMAMSDPVAVNSSGVDSVISDNSSCDAEYYTLSGVRLAERPSTPCLYIERRGGESRKIVITR